MTNNELDKINPCYLCSKRCVGCHGICGDYQAWRRLVNKFNKRMKEMENAERITRDDMFKKRRRKR